MIRILIALFLLTSVSFSYSQRDEFNKEIQGAMDSIDLWSEKDLEEIMILNNNLETRKDLISYIRGLIELIHYDENKLFILKDILTDEEYKIYNQIKIDIRNSDDSYDISPVNSSYENNEPIIRYNESFVLRFYSFLESQIIMGEPGFNRPGFKYAYMLILLNIDEYSDPFKEAYLSPETLSTYRDNFQSLSLIFSTILSITFYELHELYHLVYEKDKHSFDIKSEIAADSFAIEILDKISPALFGDDIEQSPLKDVTIFGNELDSIFSIKDMSSVVLFNSTAIFDYLIYQSVLNPSDFKFTVTDITTRYCKIIDHILYKTNCDEDIFWCLLLENKKEEIKNDLGVIDEMSSIQNEIESSLRTMDTLEYISSVKKDAGYKILTIGNLLLADKEFSEIVRLFEYALKSNLLDHNSQYEYLHFVLGHIYLKIENDFDKAKFHFRKTIGYGDYIMPEDYYYNLLSEIDKM